MTMLDETKTKPNDRAEPVTRVWDARLTKIEQRLAALPVEIQETSEQRVLILRDALADFAAAELAKRDAEIVSLQKQLADLQQKLEQQTAIDRPVHEISARIEEKQEQRDRGKNGIGDFIQTMGTLITQERQSARNSKLPSRRPSARPRRSLWHWSSA
jgi:predicted amino acid-binding ACT domain protein